MLPNLPPAFAPGGNRKAKRLGRGDDRTGEKGRRRLNWGGGREQPLMQCYKFLVLSKAPHFQGPRQKGARAAWGWSRGGEKRAIWSGGGEGGSGRGADQAQLVPEVCVSLCPCPRTTDAHFLLAEEGLFGWRARAALLQVEAFPASLGMKPIAKRKQETPCTPPPWPARPPVPPNACELSFTQLLRSIQSC